MAQTVIYIRMDEDIKASMENVCKAMGMSVSSAFTLFAQKVASEKRIPFDISTDPFYSEENMAHLRRGIAALDAGKGVEHDLLDVVNE